MYESSDREVFADFGLGEMKIYPSDMYSKDGPSGSFDVVRTLFYDLHFDTIPSLKIKDINLAEYSVMANASHAGRTADIVMQDPIGKVLKYKLQLILNGKTTTLEN